MGRFSAVVLSLVFLLSCRTTGRPPRIEGSSKDTPTTSTPSSDDSVKAKWSEPQLLTADGGPTIKISSPRLDDGTPQLFWALKDASKLFWTEYADGAWSEIVTLIEVPQGVEIRGQSVKRAADGHRVLVWTEQTLTGTPPAGKVTTTSYARFYTPAQGWGPKTVVSDANEESNFSLDMGIMSGGKGILCYFRPRKTESESDTIWLRRFENGQVHAAVRPDSGKRILVNGGVRCDLSEQGDYLLHWVELLVEADGSHKSFINGAAGRIDGVLDKIQSMEEGQLSSNSQGILQNFFDHTGNGFLIWYGASVSAGGIRFYGKTWDPKRVWGALKPIAFNHMHQVATSSLVISPENDVFLAMANANDKKRTIDVMQHLGSNEWHRSQVDSESITALDDPVLGFNDKNQFSVVYTKNSHHGWRLWWSHFRDGAWQKPEKLPELTEGDANRHSFYSLRGGRWLVVWRQLNGDRAELWYSIFG